MKDVHPQVAALLLGATRVKKVGEGCCEVPWSDFRDRVLPNHCTVAWHGPYFDQGAMMMRIAALSQADFFTCSLRGGTEMTTRLLGEELNSSSQPLCQGCYRAPALDDLPQCVGSIHVKAWKRKHPGW